MSRRRRHIQAGALITNQPNPGPGKLRLLLARILGWIWSSIKLVFRKIVTPFRWIKSGAKQLRHWLKADAKKTWRGIKKSAKKIVNQGTMIFFWILLILTILALIYGIKHSATIALFSMYFLLLLWISRRTMIKKNTPSVKCRRPKKIGFIWAFGITFRRHYYWASPVAAVFLAVFIKTYQG